MGYILDDLQKGEKVSRYVFDALQNGENILEVHTLVFVKVCLI